MADGGGDQGPLDLVAGGVAAGVDDPGQGVAAFPGQGQGEVGAAVAGRSNEAPSAISSRSRVGPSPTSTRTASGSHSPPPAERVSEKCSSGESPGDSAAATPPWA